MEYSEYLHGFLLKLSNVLYLKYAKIGLMIGLENLLWNIIIPNIVLLLDSNIDRKSGEHLSALIPRQLLQGTQDHQEAAVYHVVQRYVDFHDV